MTDVDLISALYALRDRAVEVHEYPMATVLRDAACRLKELTVVARVVPEVRGQISAGLNVDEPLEEL